MVIVADLHFGNTSSTKMEGAVAVRDLDVFGRLMEVLEVATRDDKVILVAGDIGHKPEVRNEVRSLMFSFLAECRKQGVSVVLMPGNHDAGSQSTSAALFRAAELDNCRVITAPGMVDVFGHRFLAMPHIPRADLVNIENGYGSYSAYVSQLAPEAEIVIGHTMISNTGYENDVFFEAADSMEFDSTAFGKLKLAIMGHIHMHWELNTSNGGVVVYPGSVATNNFGEIDEDKGYLILDRAGNYEWNPWNTPETYDYVQVDIDLASKGPETLDYDALSELADSAIVKVVVSAASDVVVPESRIRKAVGSKGYLSKIDIIRVKQGDGLSELDEADMAADSFRDALDHHTLLDEFLNESGAAKGVIKAAKEAGHTIIDDVVGGST